MTRSNVKVVLRTRPCAGAQPHFHIDTAAKTITITREGRSTPGLPCDSDRSGPSQRHQFQFDGILHGCSQEDVFEMCAADMVQQTLEGYNGCIMCYGQTGAGKTFTMSGNTASYQQRGLIPRVLAALLAALRSSPGLSSWGLSLSYLEIYNDVLYDLLDINTSPSELTLYEDGAGQLQVSGVRKVSVRSEAEALALFFEGEANRVIGEHQLNRESSRSHSVFIIHTTCTREGDDDDNGSSSKLCLVDLAGSERVAKTRSEGLLLREAGAINKSLALLEQVVLAAAAAGRGTRQHVPYRSSKLTHVLKDCLGGNCATLMIANVWGEDAQLEETLSTCRFASRMAALEVEVTRNALAAGQRGSSARVRALEREVQELREELAMMDMMHKLASQQQHQQQVDFSSSQASSSNSSTYAPFSEAQRQQLRQTVITWLQKEQQQQQQQQQQSQCSNEGELWQQQQYYQGSLAPLPLNSVRQLRELLFAFKAVMQDVIRGRPPTGSSAASCSSSIVAAGGNGPAAARIPPLWPKQQHQDMYQQQQQHGGCVGDGDDPLLACAAPDNARPASYGGMSAADTDWAASTCAPLSDPGTATAGPGPSSLAAAADGTESAMMLYRQGAGAEKARMLNDNHNRLRAAKKRRQELAGCLNSLKAQLDGLQEQQEGLKQQRLMHTAAAAAAAASGMEYAGSSSTGVADAVAAAQVLQPEEYNLVMAIRDIKSKYRDAHAELQLVRDEVGYTAGLLEACKTELQAGFEEWYSTTYGSQQAEDGASSSPAQDASNFPLATSRPDSCYTGLSSPTASSWHAQAAASAGSPSRLSSTGSSHLQQQQQQQRRRHSTPPLASLVGALSINSSGGGSLDGGGGSLSAETAESEASAFYEAQRAAALGRATSGPRAGSAKKHRGERGTFSLAGRSTGHDVHW